MKTIRRRDFLKISAAGGAVCAVGPGFFSNALRSTGQEPAKIISPGCRTSKVKVAKIYMGRPSPHWPKPTLNLSEEVGFYESQFARL